MRPIKLKVKGLNSFIEEQIIDFTKLTERGLFGIFGPTGSGKSTILDGITLALYGQVSRKSSNYINTNCDSLNVSFEFQISGIENKIYIVSREFKRDNKSGNPRTSRAKIIYKTNESEEVLADKAQKVTEKCEEIIGLGIDDFTRTVVLPQGKFSEFLKLEGKSRREMLERLFNLKRYGDELSIKLSRRIKNEKFESNLLTGELKGYEDISFEKLNLKNEELELSKKQLSDKILEFRDIEKKYKISEEIWNLQIELESYKKQEQDLNEKADEINKDKIKLNLGEAALKVSPYLYSYENTLSENYNIKKQKEKLELDFKKVRLEKEDSERKLLEITKKKDEKIPELKLKEQKIKDTIEEKDKLDLLEKEIENISSKVQILREEYKKENNKFMIVDSNIKNTDINIKKLEEEFENLKVNDEFKSKIQEGLLINEKYNLFENNIKTNKNKIDSLNKEIEDLKINLNKLKEVYYEKNNLLNNSKEELEQHIKNSPGKQEDLLNLQNSLNNCSEKWSKFNQCCEEIKKSEILIENYSKYLKVKVIERENVNEELMSIKEKYKECEIENLSLKIRENLKVGEKCPVCGSIEHKVDFKKDVACELEGEKVNELSNKIIINEDNIKKLDQEITVYNTKLDSEKEKIKEKNAEIGILGTEFKKVELKNLQEEFNFLKKSIDEYEVKKQFLENKIDKLKEENHNLEKDSNKVSILLKEKENQINIISKELRLNLEDFQKIKEKLDFIKNETKVIDFDKKNKEIIKIEKNREELAIKIKEYRSSMESLIKEKDALQDTLKCVMEKGTDARASLNEKIKNREEKLTIIKEKLKNEFLKEEDFNNINKENLIDLLNEVKEKIRFIEEQFKIINEIKDKAYSKYEKCNEEYISIVTKENELIKRCEIEKEKLNENLKAENFQSIEDLKEKIITQNQIEILKEKIEKYKDSLSKINGAIENLEKKLNGREINKAQWENIKQSMQKNKNEVDRLTEIKIKLDEEYKFIENKLKELKELLTKKEKIDHKLAVLDDLDKLFKGKKFVEFVAINQLKYISLEASKKLKEITSGNYGLEVDENGKFIIRDYKNGGAERDATTLSGGETFLASLSLALALSSQIQLKGTAPLELFFLDEGFGTLDDNLLEVVMNSLERLHNEKLKVGIISHVESIKNRVPVKLILTPAECGKGGSKVKLERS